MPAECVLRPEARLCRPTELQEMHPLCHWIDSMPVPYPGLPKSPMVLHVAASSSPLGTPDCCSLWREHCCRLISLSRPSLSSVVLKYAAVSQAQETANQRKLVQLVCSVGSLVHAQLPWEYAAWSSIVVQLGVYCPDVRQTEHHLELTVLLGTVQAV